MSRVFLYFYSTLWEKIEGGPLAPPSPPLYMRKGCFAVPGLDKPLERL